MGRLKKFIEEERKIKDDIALIIKRLRSIGNEEDRNHYKLRINELNSELYQLDSEYPDVCNRAL